MKLLFALFSLLLSVSVQAADLPFAGTWKGSIGDNKVMVCFSASDAQYYYLRHLRGIGLVADEKLPAFTRWRETLDYSNDDDNTTGIWTVPEAVNGSVGNTLDLTWSSPDGKKKIPVRLTKVPTLAAPKRTYSDCGPEFYRPIEEGMRYTTNDLKMDGKEYRGVTTQTGAAFELPASVPGSKAFNDTTRNWLKQIAIDHYECVRNGGGVDWERSLEPLVWTDSKLVVKDWMPEVFCSGGRGNTYLEYASFDLHTGKKINTWSWIKQGEKSVESKDKNEQKPGLRAMLEKKVDQEECREVNDVFTTGKPYAGKDGMVFRLYYFHAMRMCEDDITIPYKSIAPYLTPAGKAAVAEFLRP
ncbi:hypothetical protein ACO0LM_19870 [Undibacterium sp. Di26W]|uniref:hypothetical protein n=1 Tax=Undibacterium sp. Di26W TaxID=3413035 RepID=UPI003BF077EC